MICKVFDVVAGIPFQAHCFKGFAEFSIISTAWALT